MANTSEKWLEKAISDGHINFLEYNKFTVLAKIGNGGFGDVLKCEWKENELTVALKCLRINTSLDETIEDFIKELKLLNKIQSHQNVIAFHGVTKDNDGQYNMVLEYANEGTLQEYLKVNSNHLQWIDKSRIAKEISHGLLFLHNNNIIYRDLHSKNILIHQQKPKIADFGLSKQINETSMTSNSKVYGMPAYVEPQCFSNTGYKRDKKSDVYSFGVILWEISSGKPPFQSVDSMFIHIHILNGNRETPKEG
ncbi:kinase-like protein [Gigaspora margarita]|uniref:Kinase-like protein n=1 Tax=Gigaspora margarita TaxID=4874 RepID=A0A8H4EP59_GIGMA|nr:kinase-like protein [Gigaspora margarita]